MHPQQEIERPIGLPTVQMHPGRFKLALWAESVFNEERYLI